MFSLYMLHRGELSLCERYDTTGEAVQETIAMWLENTGSQVVEFLYEGDEPADKNLIATFVPVTDTSLIVVQTTGNVDAYTDLKYLTNDAGRIYATEGKKNGLSFVMNHRTF